MTINKDGDPIIEDLTKAEEKPLSIYRVEYEIYFRGSVEDDEILVEAENLPQAILKVYEYIKNTAKGKIEINKLHVSFYKMKHDVFYIS